MQRALFASTNPPKVTAYTDGGCDPNPGPGGWAAILTLPDGDIVLSGNDPDTTNNQMELEAAIAALAYLSGRYERCQVELYTDSQYLRQGITSWIDAWIDAGWRTKKGQPVKNQARWRRLYELAEQHDIKWQWVKGHTGHPQNERVDALATAARERRRVAATPVADASAAVLGDAPSAKLAIGVTCQGSIGPGAWAVVIERQTGRQVLCERAAETTSNRLYLAAATEGLRALDTPHQVAVYAASNYLVRGASEWVHGWQQRGWRTASGSPVKNQAQWQGLLQAAGRHHVTWHLSQQEAQEAKEIAEKEAAR